jgi:CheY-like chemotaxis protein
VVPAAPSTREPGQILVMVADDSKVVRVKTSRLLAAHQFRVVLAEDGTQALQLMAQEPPQVLITDVEMPGMDGLELTRTVRADARTASMPVVMITSADDRLRDQASAAGVTVLMGKPYTDLDLIGHVARLAGVTLNA